MKPQLKYILNDVDPQFIGPRQPEPNGSDEVILDAYSRAVSGACSFESKKIRLWRTFPVSQFRIFTLWLQHEVP